MSQPYHGKKIGNLTVRLDRKTSQHTWASVDVELRFDIHTGTFYAQWDGAWYKADTKDALSNQIKIAATKAFSIVWRRYIQIDYEAEARPIEDPKSGRHASSGELCHFGIDDRSTPHFDGDPFVICGINLHWSLCDFSDPYAPPENPKKQIRAKREVDIYRGGDNAGEEWLRDPEERDDDALPPGMLLWTPEREALLVEIIAALGKLDQRLVDLLSGDPSQLAAKIDAAAQLDPSRLLAAPSEPPPTQTPNKKRRRA